MNLPPLEIANNIGSLQLYVQFIAKFFVPDTKPVIARLPSSPTLLALTAAPSWFQDAPDGRNRFGLGRFSQHQEKGV
jgi:hypothetical protein